MIADPKRGKKNSNFLKQDKSMVINPVKAIKKEFRKIN